MKKWLPVFLMITVLLGNDSVYNGAGTDVKLIRSKNIRMVSDSVLVTMRSKNWFQVTVITFLRNEGPQEKVKIGFPVSFNVDISLPEFHPDSIPDSLTMIAEPEAISLIQSKIRDFTISVDGQQIPLTVHYTFDPINVFMEVVFLFELEFDTGQTRRLVHSYELMSSGSSIGDWYFEYILKTGALWKGSIANLTIQVESPGDMVPHVHSISPGEQHALKKEDLVVLLWNYQIIEPDFNLELGGLQAHIFELNRAELMEQIARSEL